MTTKITNTAQTPAQRFSEIPADSIIRQVATPSPFPLQSLPPHQQLLIPPQQFLVPPQQILVPPQQMLVSGSQQPPSFSGSSRMLQTAQFVGGQVGVNEAQGVVHVGGG